MIPTTRTPAPGPVTGAVFLAGPVDRVRAPGPTRR